MNSGMVALTIPEATVLAALAAAVAAVLAPGVKGLGFLIQRRMTGASADERLDRGIKAAQLLALMESRGEAAQDVRQMGELLRRPEIMASPLNKAIVEQAAEETEPGEYGSDYAMKARAGASYDAAQARLEQMVVDLALLLGAEEATQLAVVQRAWADYRDALAGLARAQFAGGTHAGLAGVMTALAETERRTAELRELVRERRG